MKFTDIDDKYYMKFKEFPPQLVGINNNSEKYQKIVSEAIEKNIKLTSETMANLFYKKGLTY